jgi:hypothetical protein
MLVTLLQESVDQDIKVFPDTKKNLHKTDEEVIQEAIKFLHKFE